MEAFRIQTESVGNFGEAHSIECRRGKAKAETLRQKDEAKIFFIFFFSLEVVTWVDSFLFLLREEKRNGIG